MAEIAHLAWYRQGTVSVADGSTTVTGHGTNFLSAGINQGAAFRIDNRFYVAEIKRVVSDTELELATAYYGGTVSNASYSIDRNHQSTLPADLSARLAKAMGNWEARYDLDMQTITGKSAYEIAVENGYTGTEAQWLESLKAAGEWSTLNDRTNILTYHNAAAHNSIYRGKNLGTAINSSVYANIRNYSFADIYPGDYWQLPIDGTTIATVIGCYVNYMIDKPHVLLWLRNTNWTFTINDTNTCAGHLMGSKMYTTHLPYILGKIKEVIPDANILPWTERIGDSIDSSGNVNHWTDIGWDAADPVKIGIPSFCNLVGYDITNNHGYDIAGRNPNWPAFRLNPQQNYFAVYTWLDSNSSASDWNYSWWTKVHMVQGPATKTTGDAIRQMCVFPYIHIG